MYNRDGLMWRVLKSRGL